ncbi:ATP-binding protein [Streptosporangium sp. NPDC051023]|uniref:AAA family ATPase n=1 Tax=Streptosporangium sp. NPDC051023 TaxID=3155410 RepID=UPI00344C5B77
MLLRFKAANHRSFRDEFELHLTATKFNQGSARRAGLLEEPDLAYVPAAVVYGANGSGKSNVLTAMRWMQQAVLHSVDRWSAGSVADDWQHRSPVPREPFMLDLEARLGTSHYEVDFVLDGDRYVYGFEVSDERVEAEWLHAYPGGQARRQVWFEREADTAEPFRFPGEGLKGAKESLVPRTKDTALFLTVAADYDHPQLSPIRDWFRGNFWWVSLSHDQEARRRFTASMLRDPVRRRQIVSLLKVADLGIVGAEVEHEGRVPRIRLIHEGISGPIDMDFQDESAGTQSWFAFIGPMLEALDKGALLLVDELDACLHPLLAAEVVRTFQNEQANPRHAQFVATLHDVTLISGLHPQQPLDRDQVWITEKAAGGRSELYPLTDARPRKDEPLARRYLSGAYGGIPRVHDGDVADAITYTPDDGVRAERWEYSA